MGAGAAAALLPVIADALATLIATGVGTSVGSGSGGKVVAGGTAAGVELYNRQLHPDEQKLLEKQAKELAKEKGISEEEATRRLAEAFAFYTDADWQAVIAGKAEIDSATLIHLGLALAPLGSRYDVVAIEGDVPSVGMPDSKTYTAAETLRLLQNYQLTHAAAFNNPLINSEYLGSVRKVAERRSG
ncbi:hypothetical protein [Pseudomonas indica]|uniref:Filamentous hemagglutinin n=1 Tax=Pseudomonas indica TaxID=137658 RepID=A0A1G9QIL9_9PSED|nr:hypothetical protein [Pseudomonas indica]SDM10710.1 filamentous hemagglutinin [Pseudomonas indica]